MKNWNYNHTWYHGSPLRLSELLEGSTITQDRELARIFSHKPSVVASDGAGGRYHNGRLNGYLYVIDEKVGANDVYPHPETTMRPGEEWLITRPLKVKRISETEPILLEQLSIEDEETLLKKLER